MKLPSKFQILELNSITIIRETRQKCIQTHAKEPVVLLSNLWTGLRKLRILTCLKILKLKIDCQFFRNVGIDALLSSSWLKRSYGFRECRPSLRTYTFPPSENINEEAKRKGKTNNHLGIVIACNIEI